jgi:hypothetical protein
MPASERALPRILEHALLFPLRHEVDFEGPGSILAFYLDRFCQLQRQPNHKTQPGQLTVQRKATMIHQTIRRIILLAAFSMIASWTQQAHAQAALLVLLFGDDVASEDFFFSLKLGANVADVTDVEGGSTRVGLNFGLLATIKLGDQFYVVPEFSPMSFKGISDFPITTTGDPNLDALVGTDLTSSYRLNYIDLPVVVKYYPVKTLAVGVGPYAGYLLLAERRIRGELSSSGTPITLEEDVKGKLNRWDYGAVFELVYAPWRTGKTDFLNIHVRYALGLANLEKASTGTTMKNSVFQFFVSFPFMEPPAKEQ